MDAPPDSLIARALPPAIIVVVLLVALVPALLVAMGRSEDAQGLGGDFPSFYGAGEIVLDGEVDALYDPAVQRKHQSEFHDAGEYLYFAYPPFVAAAYAPLAMLPYGIALSIHIIISVGALAGAAWLAVPRIVPSLSRTRHVVLAVAISLLMYPILRAVLGGQNTTFTLVILMAMWWLLDQGSLVASGAVGGLLLYKPQFGLVALAVIILLRAWRAVAGFVGTGVVLWVMGALMHGPQWPRWWLDQVTEFGALNERVNGHLMVNVWGWMAAALPNVSEIVSVAMAVAVAIAVGVVVVRVGVRWGVIGVVLAGIVLIAPSALYYDAGLALFGFGIFVALVLRNAWWMAVGLAASWTQLFAPGLGWSPLFIVVVLCVVGELTSRFWPANVSHPTGTLAALARPDGGESTWPVTESS